MHPFFRSICSGFVSSLFLCLLVSCGDNDVSPDPGPPEPSTSNTPTTQWHKGYGTDRGEHIHEVMETSDGGFLGIGQTEDSGGGETSDILVIKIDAEGDFLWQRIIGQKDKFDVGVCVNEVSDGYLIGGGLSQEGSQQRYLAKLSFSGETVWQQTYQHSGHGKIRGIALADNGDILVTGFKAYADPGFVFIADESEGFVLRTNSQGELLWEKPLSTSQGAKIRKDQDGYIICTTHWMNDPDHPQDFYLIKLDNEGNELWAKNYGGDSDEHCYDCDVAMDGGYILGGHTRSPSYGVVNWDFLLMKINKEGVEEWHQTFGQPRGYDPRYIHDEAYGVRQTPDGGFVLVGGSGDEHTYSASGHSRGKSDIWQVYAVKVDAAGEVEWEGIYGDARSNDAGEYIGLTSDGGFIIGTDSDAAGAENFEPNNFGFLKIK
ncbi:MAG: hypothetical protein AAF587_17195 [Bacteroidota bacterium]